MGVPSKYKNKFTLVGNGNGRAIRTSKNQLQRELLELGDDKIYT